MKLIFNFLFCWRFVGAVSTAEQREEIIESCNGIEDWLYEDGRTADLSEYKSKQSGVKVKAEAIFKVNATVLM